VCHRSPHLWKDPDTFNPDRFSETFTNEAFGGNWAGYRPEAQGSSLYPNEVASDFAFIPFGGGVRKCVGDQFALLEATVAMVLLLRCGRMGDGVCANGGKLASATLPGWR
jgi:cytochrome P450 family 97 subfamily B polypeptide 3